MDGFEATRKIRQLEGELKARSSKLKEKDGSDASAFSLQLSARSERVPIVAMTAHAVKGYSKKCLDAGMDGFISKPLRRKQFLAMVDKWARGIDNHQSNPQPPMNFEKAVEEFMGKEDVVTKIVTAFLDKVKDQIGTIRQAITQGNAEAVREEAHSIKGGAANLTAYSLSGVALELEDIGRSGDLGQAPDALDRLEEEFHRLEAYADLAMEEKVK
jgi:HPt (histidine-containing phosphotransfer) domain-containing protein